MRKQPRAEICEKCGKEMVKTGVMDSGNSKYDLYACKSCSHKQMKCTGLN